jgi:hypothetical protein
MRQFFLEPFEHGAMTYWRHQALAGDLRRSLLKVPVLAHVPSSTFLVGELCDRGTPITVFLPAKRLQSAEQLTEIIP